MRNALHSAGKTGVTSSTRPEPDLRTEFTRRRFLLALGAGGAGAAAGTARRARQIIGVQHLSTEAGDRHPAARRTTGSWRSPKFPPD